MYHNLDYKRANILFGIIMLPFPFVRPHRPPGSFLLVLHINLSVRSFTSMNRPSVGTAKFRGVPWKQNSVLIELVRNVGIILPCSLRNMMLDSNYIIQL